MKKQQYSIEDLLLLMSRLRDPQTGCPWDLQQDYRSLAPYMLEEAYEVVDTIERWDMEHFPEELGDLLFQVVFHAQVATEEGRFDFNDVVNTITAKLVDRHPHVFPRGTLDSKRESSAEIKHADINRVWEQKKQLEREKKGHRASLADIPVAFPALTRAQKVQKRAAKLGFDWSEVSQVFEKVREEFSEMEAEFDSGDSDRLDDELGDIFFSLVNLSRHLHVDAESCLRRATTKFEHRFCQMEKLLEKSGRSIDEVSEEEFDEYWIKAKTLVDG